MASYLRVYIGLGAVGRRRNDNPEGVPAALPAFGKEMKKAEDRGNIEEDNAIVKGRIPILRVLIVRDDRFLCLAGMKINLRWLVMQR